MIAIAFEGGNERLQLAHREIESLNLLSFISFTRFFFPLDFFLISLTCDQWVGFV